MPRRAGSCLSCQTLGVMNRRLFSGEKAEFRPLGYREPCWRQITVRGWFLLICGTLSVISLFVGLVSGEVFFLPPVESRSGASLIATLSESPIWFVLLIAANAVVAFVIWGQFFHWLRKRAQ